MLTTEITERFGLTYPIMSAPMAMHSGGQLAGAVTQAGGLGLFGGINPAGAEWLRSQIKLARNMSSGRPFGVGFITHLIPVFPQLFELALEENVPVIAFSFADPDPWLARAKAGGATTICQVQSLEGAAQAVAAGTDMLVAQGNEAGGHTGSARLMPLLTEVVARYPDIPVLAAGGIADGDSLAAALSAGAAGAWVGTALMATPDCVEVSDDYKRLLVETRSEDTVYTKVFDILDEVAYGLPPWPEEIAGRVIANETTRHWHGREEELRGDLDEVLPGYQRSLAEKDVKKIGLFAGESVGAVNAIRAVADVIQDICDSAERVMA